MNWSASVRSSKYRSGAEATSAKRSVNEAAEVLPKLIDAFSDRQGGIQKMSVYDRIGAGVALTDINYAARTGRPALHVDAVASERRDLRATRLVMRALDLHNRALQHLSSASRRILVLRLHGIVEALLSQREGGRAEEKPLQAEDYATFEEELEAAMHIYDESVQRSARIRYLFGAWLALLPFLAIGAYMLIDPSGLFDLSNNEQLLMASTLSGATGAVVSVMTRLSGRNLTLTGLDEATRWTVFVFGAVRAVLGAAFGALVFLFIFSTVLDIKVPEPPAASFETRLYFLIVLGFVAGFSERFARDTIAGAEASLGTSGGAQETAAGSGSAQQASGR